MRKLKKAVRGNEMNGRAIELTCNGYFDIRSIIFWSPSEFVIGRANNSLLSVAKH